MKKKSTVVKAGAGDGGIESLLSRPIARRSLLKGALAAAPLLVVGPTLLLPKKAHAATNIGPSTSIEPYLVPSVSGVDITSILTVGDSIGGYRMVGIPDGLGAFRSRRGQFTLLMNHEITAARPGVVRAHGSNGAFVSRWTIDQETLEVIHGEDLTQSALDVFTWNTSTNQYQAGTTQWQRLCSADLAERSAYFAKGLGTQDRLFLDGEEVDGGRMWARVASGPHAGEAWQLSRFGLMATENSVACPHAQLKTIVMITEDGNLNTAGIAGNFPSEVYVYVGTKTKQGHPIERAGLTNGDLYGIKVSVNGNPVAEETDANGLGTSSFIGSGRFTLHNFGNVSNLTALQFSQAAITAGVTRFRRPEDGAWDPRNRFNNDFYFVTTADINTNCRLWRLRFDEIENPEAGGAIEILLRGNEGHRMLDNVTIDHFGRILMDEDPGNNPRVSKIWLYQIATGELIEVAHHNPKFFDPTFIPATNFITQDEESSGIIDASRILGEGWFLLDVQSHKVNTLEPELVEGGQLLAMFVDPSIGAAPEDEDD